MKHQSTHLALAFMVGLGLVLGGCGGGGSDDPPAATPPTATGPTVEEQRDALLAETAALRAQLGLEATGDVGQSVAALQQELTVLKGQVQDIQDAEAAAERKANSDMAKMLLGALKNPTPAFDTEVEGVEISAVVGQAAKAMPVTALTPAFAGTAIAPLGDWSGTDLTRMDATNISDHMVVYTDVGFDTTKPFVEAVPQAGIDRALTLDDPAEMNSADGRSSVHLKSSEFSDSGTKTHEFNSKKEGAPADNFVQFGGTYMGAMGTYSCEAEDGGAASNCTSDLNANGTITLSAGWIFTADEGAMVMLPDNDYLHFGWWLRDTTLDTTGTDRMVSTFSGATNVAVMDATGTGVLGSATYTGAAAGKYAIDNPLAAGEDAAMGGAFTADAMLTANFDTDRVKGTISGFRSGDTMMEGWKVDLLETEISATGFDSATDEEAGTPAAAGVGTQWTIGTRKEARSGMWMGAFHVGRNDGQPDAAVGEFSSSYGSIGRMVGGFGVHNDVPDDE